MSIEERIRKGDREVFGELFKTYAGQLFRLAFSYVHDEDAAYDILQQTFEKAMRSASTFKGNSSARAWLAAILKNTALNYIRDRKKCESEEAIPITLQEAPTLGETALQPLPFLLRKEEAEQLIIAYNALPPVQREVVRLRIEHNFSFKEIASALNISVSAAKTNFHYAVKNLKRLVNDSAASLEQEEVSQ